MEQTINKLSEMLGVGVQEVYTVLQATAKIDGEIAYWGLCGGIILIFLGLCAILLIIYGFHQQDIDKIMVGIVFTLSFIGFGIGITRSEYRTYKLCIENPKGYAIEKILKNTK